MNKILSFIYIAISLFLLSACSRVHTFNYDTLAGEVAEIKIVQVIQEWGSLEYEVISEIDNLDHEAFLLELSQLKFYIPFYGD